MRILIIEPIPLLLEALKEKLPNLHQVTDLQALDCLNDLQEPIKIDAFDILWIDSSLYNKSCGLFKKIIKQYRELKIVIFGNQESIPDIRRYFSHGVTAYLPKTSNLEIIQEALVALKSEANCQYIPTYLRESCLNWFLLPPQKKKSNTAISPREKEILNLIVQEYTTGEIAKKLFLSGNTVETHRNNLIHKMGVKNTAGLVRVAVETGLYAV